MNPRSAIAIGMLPDLPLERYVPIGNSSLQGAALALTSAERHRRDRPHPRPHHLPRAQRQPGLHEPLQRRQVPAAHGCRPVSVGPNA
ncbi:MAG: ATP-binding protein [Desulfobacterales bacterium]|nr:ATP-binding protein [Desulfobacterales bacterium]